MEKVFDRIKRLALEQGIKPHKLRSFVADAADVSYQAVAKWDKGASDPDFESLERLAPALGVTVNELRFGREADEEENLKARIIQKVETMPLERRRLIETILGNEKLLEVLEAQSKSGQ